MLSEADFFRGSDVSSTATRVAHSLLCRLITEAPVFQKLSQLKHVGGHAETLENQLLKERGAPTAPAEAAGLWPGLEPFFQLDFLRRRQVRQASARFFARHTGQPLDHKLRDGAFDLCHRELQDSGGLRRVLIMDDGAARPHPFDETPIALLLGDVQFAV